tara:strand:+ start:401 stop:649 length:249 start_codon:yes stop_codon:yes gene_type:complete
LKKFKFGQETPNICLNFRYKIYSTQVCKISNTLVGKNKLQAIMKIKLIKKNKLKTNINKKFKKISIFELQNSPKFLNFRVRA